MKTRVDMIIDGIDDYLSRCVGWHAYKTVSRDDLKEWRAEMERLREYDCASLRKWLPCGHPVQAAYVTNEGKEICKWCSDIGRIDLGLKVMGPLGCVCRCKWCGKVRSEEKVRYFVRGNDKGTRWEVVKERRRVPSGIHIEEIICTTRDKAYADNLRFLLEENRHDEAELKSSKE